MNHVTMEDIAERTGVSINTVSRALNDKPDINEETKKEILRVADELDYQPNRFAQGLRSSKTYTLGVIVADIQNPFFSALLKGVEKAARKEGYSIIVQDTDENYENEKTAIKTALAEQVDGLLISPVQTNDQTIIELEQSELPFVLLGRHFDKLNTPYVVTDDVHGASAAVDHLVDRGHERIALINGPAYISSSKERFKGYRRAMKDHDISIPDAFVLENNVTIENGYKTARELLSRPERPTAVLCYSDFVALGVLKAARNEGLKIPEDLAVVGYDDIFFSTCLETPLTTVRIPKRELGNKAFEILIDLMAEKCNENSFFQQHLEPDLVIRASS